MTIRTNRIARGFALFAAVALTAGAAGTASAADPSNGSVEAKMAAKPVKEQRYCVKQQEARTGSILNKAKVCKTRDEWIAATGVDPAK